MSKTATMIAAIHPCDNVRPKFHCPSPRYERTR